MAKATGTTAPTAADFDEADDLFGADGASTTGADFDEADDLLNSVDEDDAEGWNPSERGEAVSGVVVKVGETRSDFATSEEDAMCPTVTVQTKDGDKYRIIGFGAVLRRELQDANAKVGDLLAVKYWGEKPIKKGKFAGKNYRHFSVAIKHK
jgi:hypothetical protein